PKCPDVRVFSSHVPDHADCRGRTGPCPTRPHGRARGPLLQPTCPRGRVRGPLLQPATGPAPYAQCRGDSETESRPHSTRGRYRRKGISHMAKIALIGAGSVVWARRLMMDILSFKELTGATLSLMDIDPVRLETAKKTVGRLVAQVNASAKV